MDFKFHSVVKKKRRITTVLIKKGSTIIAVGTTKQSRDDKDVRAIGQKIAVKNAIKNINPEERRVIWNEFFKHSKRTGALIGLC